MTKKIIVLFVLASMLLSIFVGSGCGGKKSDSNDAVSDDTTVPTVDKVTAGNITGTTADITWETSEPATSQVEYGIAVAYGSNTTLVEELTTTHTVKLESLTSQTIYHYRVRSKDAASNEAVSPDLTFSTPDVTSPGISKVAVADITTTAADITWETSEPATSQVEYGTSTNYGSATTPVDVLAASHSVKLEGLSPNTTYHFQVVSKDVANNEVVSPDSTFATLNMAVAMMMKTPQKVNLLGFMDIKTMRGDTDLAALCADVRGTVEGTLSSYGVDFNNVDYLGGVDRTPNKEYTLLEGSIDMSAVRTALQTLKLTAGDYEGVELWSDSDNSRSVALLEGTVVFGDAAGVEDCLDVIKGLKGSLYDDVNFKDVAQRLEYGVEMQFEARTFAEEEYASLLVSGSSANKKDASTLALTGVCKFENVSAATDTLDDLKLYLETDVDTTNPIVTQEEQFLRLTAEQSTESTVGTDMADMMKRTPQGASLFSFTDVKTMRGDEDLAKLYDSFLTSSGTLASWGIEARTVDYDGSVSWSDSTSLVLLEGHFDLNKVRDTLKALGYTSGDYKGVEVWASGGIALMRGLVVYGSATRVEECIDVIQGRQGSLYEGGTLRDLSLKLQDGIQAWVSAGSSYGGTEYAGLLVSGLSIDKKDASTLTYTDIYEFESETAASNAKASFYGAEQDGRFLKSHIDIAI